jgi:hypothetical protein
MVSKTPLGAKKSAGWFGDKGAVPEGDADGWYAGSGATQESGRIFGYTLRPSGGVSRLTKLAEASANCRLGPQWSVNGYVGMASSGPVVRPSFASGPATFFYLENVLQF